MPTWITAGYEEYAKRLPSQFSLHLIELPLPKRSKQTVIARVKQQEAELIRNAIPQGSAVVALDVKGQSLDSETLSSKLHFYFEENTDVSLLVGGPDGLDIALVQSADWKWSLSPLTLPHPLVRVVIAEQIYRAWSLITNHPYHR